MTVEEQPKDVEKQDESTKTEQPASTEEADVAADRAKLEAEYNQLKGQNEVLKNQATQTQFQPTQAPMPTAPAEPQVAPYPDTTLAETNPAEYNKQARAYLDTTIASKVTEQVGTITQQQETRNEYNKVSKYIETEYRTELEKGLNSPLVSEATKIFQEKGIAAPQESLLHMQTMQNSLDQASRKLAVDALSATQKETTDEGARATAAAASVPDASSTLKSGGDTSLPELDSEELRINQAWGLSPEKLQAAKARLAAKEL